MENQPDITPAEEAMRFLKRLERKGVRSVHDLKATAPAATADVVSESTAGSAYVSGGAAPSGDSAAVVNDLEKLEAEVAACTLCGLHEGRTNTVFGKGSHNTKVIFIGEAPGRDEDLQGAPFVGRSGQLLTKILAAIDLQREDVFIANILKCRPPNNRDPQESEIRCCESYLKRQIALIQPKYICALGRVSAQWLLQTNAPLGTLRAGEYYYEGVRVIATYHPAALLRNPNFKKACWEDMKKLKALLDAC